MRLNFDAASSFSFHLVIAAGIGSRASVKS